MKRCLSLFDVTIYGVGLILGAGIYVLIGEAAGLAGNTLWISFILAAFISSFTALSYAELSALFPQAAAEFVFVKKAFNSEALAWIIGFIALVTGIPAVSAVAIGFANYFHLFVPFPLWFIAICLISLLALLNFFGIKESAKFNLISTIIEAGGLILIILVGGFFILTGKIPLINLFDFPIHSTNPLEVFSPIIAATGLVFFAFIGFEDIANIAEETSDASKVLPKAFIYSLGFSALLYVLIAIISVSVIPFNELALAKQPLSLVLHSLIGGFSNQLIAVIALFATANTVLVMLIVGSRMMYGMAKNNSFPKIFSTLHSKTRTPWVSILVFSLISMFFVFFKSIGFLAAVTNIGIFILFFFVNLSAIVLRFSKTNFERPWKMPLNIGKIPLLSVFGALSSLIMIFSLNQSIDFFGLKTSSLIIALIVFGSSIPLYYLIGRKKN